MIPLSFSLIHRSLRIVSPFSFIISPLSPFKGHLNFANDSFEITEGGEGGRDFTSHRSSITS